MHISEKKITADLLQWVNSIRNQVAEADVLTLIALIRICHWYNADLQPQWNNLMNGLLADNPHLPYAKNDLITALLASDVVMDYGNLQQRKIAGSYRQLLMEVMNSDNDNAHVLQAALTHMPMIPAPQLHIEVPRYNNDIDSMMRATLSLIETATYHGRLTVAAEPLLAAKIEAMSVCAQRYYDVSLAMRCLRVRNYLSSAPSLAMRTSVHFIENQQAADGSFGDYDSALVDIPEKNRHQARLHIQLTVALQVVWTLFELQHPTNNLFKQLYLSHLDHTVTSMETAAC
ncbi:hypothetical protein [Marinicella sp. W31]|uniref:hypothetical protein n=1 Tax=Marinicella sp. W31 TaxID=3023713 RepID=UPI003757366D